MVANICSAYQEGVARRRSLVLCRQGFADPAYGSHILDEISFSKKPAMRVVNVHQAKTHLSRLLAEAEEGVPVVRLLEPDGIEPGSLHAEPEPHRPPR